MKQRVTYRTVFAIMLSILLSMGICLVPAEIPIVATVEAATAKLPAPQNVTVVVKDTTAVISWDKVKNADAYGIYVYQPLSKSYLKYKTVKSTSLVVDGLDTSVSYKFKVAALSKTKKSYRTGKYSKVVNVTFSKSEKVSSKKSDSSNNQNSKTDKKDTTVENKAKENKKVWKSIDLTTKELLGTTWEFYDFRFLVPFTQSNSYNPEKREFTGKGYIVSIRFIDKSEAVITYSDSSLRATTYTNMHFVTYAYGEELFLCVEFVNGDGNNTYVLKKDNSEKKFGKPVDLSENEMIGTWNYYDFRYLIPYNQADNYNMEKKEFNFEGFIKSIKFSNGGRATITYNNEDSTVFETNYNANSKNLYYGRGKNNYITYSYGDDLYIFVEFVNGDGKSTYVLKKDTIEKKPVDLSEKEMVGTWDYYDFRYLVPYTQSNTYNPKEKEWNSEGFIKSIKFSTGGRSTITYNDDDSTVFETNYNANSKNLYHGLGENYITYSYGGDLYIFVEFVNGDGKCTYVLKKSKN